MRQGPRLDSLPGLPLLCLVPCASCLWLTSRWACKCESNTMPSAKVPKTNNNNNTKKKKRGRGRKDNKKCGSHTYTKNRKLNFRLCQVRGRKRKNCCRNCCRNTQAAHTHGSTSVCLVCVCVCLAAATITNAVRELLTLAAPHFAYQAAGKQCKRKRNI